MDECFLSFLKTFLRQKTYILWSWCAILLCLAGCGHTLTRLTKIGQPPPLYPVVNPEERSRNIQPPLIIPAATETPIHNNSLWQTGAKAFLKDQRASCVGDIVKIKVDMDDQGKFENITNTKSQSTNKTGVPNILGFEDKLTRLLPKGAKLSTLVDTNNVNQFTGGQGSIERSETVSFMVPALVVQILKNGHLVVQGSQEIRLGQEVRKLMVQGILRPEDIDINNIAAAERLTEARLSYGGQGDITDIQRPRYGTQMLDMLSPF